MTARDDLFETRANLDFDAFELMKKKNRDYASAESPIANYIEAAHVAGCSPARYIAGRMAEKIERLGNVLARGSATGEGAIDELLDLQNFPGLIMFALRHAGDQ